MQLEWIKTGMGPVKDLISFLNAESKTSDIITRQLIRELRDNLNIFYNAYKNNIAADIIIDMLSNKAYQQAIEKNYKFKKLRVGDIEPYHILDERNKRYVGWNADRLMDKIDEKIVELKNLKQMNGNSVAQVKNNVGLMISNLFYRIKLLVDFIRSDMK